MKIREKL